MTLDLWIILLALSIVFIALMQSVTLINHSKLNTSNLSGRGYAEACTNSSGMFLIKCVGDCSC
jgi:hypothetical protein